MLHSRSPGVVQDSVRVEQPARFHVASIFASVDDNFVKKLLRRTLDREGSVRTPDDEEFLMDTQDIVQRLKDEGRHEAMQNNLLTIYRTRFEWTTGRRLRKLTGLDVDAFNRHLGRLMPRHVRRDAFDEDDNYSLTLPGLLVMDARLRSIAIMESVYQAIARCYARDAHHELFDPKAANLDDLRKRAS